MHHPLIFLCGSPSVFRFDTFFLNEGSETKKRGALGVSGFLGRLMLPEGENHIMPTAEA